MITSGSSYSQPLPHPASRHSGMKRSGTGFKTRRRGPATCSMLLHNWSRGLGGAKDSHQVHGSQLMQQLALPAVSNALRPVEVENYSYSCQGGNNRPGARLSSRLKTRAVYLDLIDRQVFEHRQRRKPGSKIVQRQSQAFLAQMRDQFQHFRPVADGRSFRNFQLQVLGI